jgi:hypothetical protein
VLTLGLFAFYFIVHTTCYCMDANPLDGNIWIKYLYALVSVSCESMTANRRSGELVVVTGIITCSTMYL